MPEQRNRSQAPLEFYRLTVFTIILLTTILSGQEAEEPFPRLAVIQKKVQKSSLLYVLEEMPTLPGEPAPVENILADGIVLKSEGAVAWLSFLPPSAAIAKLLARGEEALARNDNDQALEAFQEAARQGPDYPPAFTGLARILLQRNEYDRAREILATALEKNFIASSGHALMAKVLIALEQKKEALYHLYLAHLLNIHRPQRKSELLRLRSECGRPWKSWQYTPRYALSRQGNRILVDYVKEWQAYAMVKAMWRFDASMAKDRGGAKLHNQDPEILAEIEAWRAAIGQNPAWTNLAQIFIQGFGREFVLYEVLAPRHPEMIALLSTPALLRLVEYLDTCH